MVDLVLVAEPICGAPLAAGLIGLLSRRRPAVATWVARCMAALVIATPFAWGCSPRATQSPAAVATDSPATSPTATLSATYADTLRVGFVPGFSESLIGTFVGFRQASSRMNPKNLDLGLAVLASLYRLDAQYDVVPDLADGPCEPQGDGTVIRCRLVETTFHDGTPVTADDVRYAFELQQQPTFYLPAENIGPLTDMRVVDSRTIDFVLSSVDPPFLTTTLPTIPILPRRTVEAAYAAFVAGTKGLEGADLAELADAIDEELRRDPPVCAAHLDEVATLLEKIGVRLYREDFTSADTGTLDSCAYMGIASGFIRQAAVALGSTGLDAVAAAYWLLSTEWRPIGAGPYRLVSEGADGIHLEAWPGYHGGLAATRYLDFIPVSFDEQAQRAALLAGTVDIIQYVEADPAELGAQGIQMAHAPGLGFFALEFNVRPGRLFAERDLRRALQLCIDLERIVDAALSGGSTPIYGPVLPGSWAYAPDLPKPARDTAAARRLVEGAGWRAGADGVYRKDGVRLGADILVRGATPGRVKMADLIAKQAGDCGMDLRTRPLEWGDIMSMVGQYPHAIPGTETPFDLYIGAWSMTLDPATLGYFSSSQTTDAEHPDGNVSLNWIGFADPTFDRLVSRAMETYDQAERARLYRDAQQELAAQVPVIFLYAPWSWDAVGSSLTATGGPLDLAAPHWAWQPERMVVEKEAAP